MFLLASWRSMTKIAGSGSGSISQRYGSADPDPHKNIMDPEHWCQLTKRFTHSNNHNPSKSTILRKSKTLLPTSADRQRQLFNSGIPRLYWLQTWTRQWQPTSTLLLSDKNNRSSTIPIDKAVSNMSTSHRLCQLLAAMACLWIRIQTSLKS